MNSEATAQPAYKDPNHPSNKLRPRTLCWGCGAKGCVGKQWGNWCFNCNVERIEQISGELQKAWGNARFEECHQYGDSTKPTYWCFYIDDWLVISGYDTYEEILAAARAFTDARKEEIRQVEEEIKFIVYASRSGTSAAQDRILGRLEAALAELRRGMQ